MHLFQAHAFLPLHLPLCFCLECPFLSSAADELLCVSGAFAKPWDRMSCTLCMLLLQKACPSVLAAVVLFQSRGWQVCLPCWTEPLEKLDQARLVSGAPQPSPGSGREPRGLSQCLMSECMPSAEPVLRTNRLRPEPGIQLACTQNPVNARWRRSDVLITGLERN